MTPLLIRRSWALWRLSETRGGEPCAGFDVLGPTNLTSSIPQQTQQFGTNGCPRRILLLGAADR
jgi:hypothetical protein